MIVTGWNNGSPNIETGAGYGVRIKRKDRDRYFKKEWTKVIIELEGEGEIEVRLSKSFWRCCPELRCKEIGKWLINNKLAPWKKGSPPKFELESKGNKKFKLSCIKASRNDQ